MENTSALLFDNSRQRFFLAVEGKAVGPITTQDLYDRLSRGDCHFLNYIWAEGWPDWRSIADLEEFAHLLPKKPDKSSIQKIESKLTAHRKQQKSAQNQAGPETKEWYLHFGGSQFGPFSFAELHHVIEVQNVDDTAHLWKQEFSQWKKIKDVPEFAKSLKPALPVQAVPPPAFFSSPAPSGKTSSKTQSKIKSTSKSERRTSPRKPLVARLFLSDEKEVVVAVCRDVSVGGMQVLTDHVPGGVGTIVKLNVSPAHDSKTVKGFVAEGEIVRVLEDGRGFSFRFVKLSDEAKRAINAYVKAEGQ